MQEPEHWMCIIGPTTRDKILPGGDLPMRLATQRAFRNLTGDHADLCASGWGLSEEDVRAIRDVWTDITVKKVDETIARRKEKTMEDNDVS